MIFELFQAGRSQEMAEVHAKVKGNTYRFWVASGGFAGLKTLASVLEVKNGWEQGVSLCVCVSAHMCTSACVHGRANMCLHLTFVYLCVCLCTHMSGRGPSKRSRRWGRGLPSVSSH